MLFLNIPCSLCDYYIYVLTKSHLESTKWLLCRLKYRSSFASHIVGSLPHERSRSKPPKRRLRLGWCSIPTFLYMAKCCVLYYSPTLMFRLGSSTLSFILVFNALKTLNKVSIFTILAIFSRREICAFWTLKSFPSSSCVKCLFCRVCFRNHVHLKFVLKYVMFSCPTW